MAKLESITDVRHNVLHLMLQEISFKLSKIRRNFLIQIKRLKDSVDNER